MAWTDFILPAVVAGGSYLEYKDKKKRQKNLNSAYSAYTAAQNARAMGAGGRRSGGGGGGGGGDKRAAGKAILEQYYAQANELLRPYVDAGKESLPKQTAAFNSGVEAFTPFMQQALNPEIIRQALTREAYGAGAPALPEYLKGGK